MRNLFLAKGSSPQGHRPGFRVLNARHRRPCSVRQPVPQSNNRGFEKLPTRDRKQANNGNAAEPQKESVKPIDFIEEWRATTDDDEHYVYAIAL
jgi:hypothetical protein